MKLKQHHQPKLPDNELVEHAKQKREKRIRQLQQTHQANELLNKYSSEAIVDKILADKSENEKLKKMIANTKGRMKLKELIDRYLD